MITREWISKEIFNEIFPGLKNKSQILTDFWVVNLRQQPKKEVMENDYKTELKDLEGIYGSTIEKIDKTHLEKLERLVLVMADFVDCHQERKKYKKKLTVLQTKLTSEEMEDEDDADGDEHYC